MPAVSPSAIALNDDCLLTIFDHLTSHMPRNYVWADDRPLNDIRAASQVCRLWREVTLASHLLWGRVIDFGVPSQKPWAVRRSGLWMEEVRRRAGSEAPLWITGDVIECCRRPDNSSKSEFDSQAFFTQLLLDSWGRVEKLSVTIRRRSKQIPECILDCFASRAPILTLFEVCFHGVFGKLFFAPGSIPPATPSSAAESGRTLFADYAPSLIAIDAEQLAFRTDAPWLSNIREIDVPSWMSLRDILGMLGNTRSLEHFSLILPHNEPAISLPEVFNEYITARQGPSLSYVRISGLDLVPTAAILSYASPGAILHCFDINVDNRYPEASDRDAVPLLRRTLPLYIARYFTRNVGSIGVILDISPGCFELCDNTTRTTSSSAESRDDSDYYSDRNPIGPGSFRTRISGYPSHENMCGDALTTSLLDTFVEASTLNVNSDPKRPLFASIRHIVLSSILKYDRQISATLYPHFYAFLAVFDHVRSIVLNELSVQILWNTIKIGTTGETGCGDSDRGSGAHHVLFPKLHTVYLTCRDSNYSKGPPPPLTQFLLERKRIGFPVTRFDLTHGPRSYDARDLRQLEQVGGLEVVWRRVVPESGLEETCRYICGSGDPDKLKVIF